MGSYSYRVRRESNQNLLTGLVRRLREFGLVTGEAGFNCDFHAIRHHGDDTVLEKHYAPAPNAPVVLTFFAHDHTSTKGWVVVPGNLVRSSTLVSRPASSPAVTQIIDSAKGRKEAQTKPAGIEANQSAVEH